MTDALVRYDSMCKAIAECHRVDEVADLKNKARAMEIYAQQAGNREAELRAGEIRLRAARRYGELLKELARATPADAARAGGEAKAAISSGVTRQAAAPSAYADALQRTRVSRQTANRYEALADVPKETFEAAFRTPEKPTMTAILASNAARQVLDDALDPPFQMPDDSLWLWGRVRDLERDGFFKKDPEQLLEPMTEQMAAQMRRLLPLCVKFFTKLNEATHHVHS